MQRIEPTALRDALMKWGEHERDGRWKGENITAAEALARRQPITSRLTAPRDVFRARIDPSDIPRVRLGVLCLTIPQWLNRINTSDTIENVKSREGYARLVATDQIIDSTGMLILVEKDSDDALLHVLDGYHRASAWAAHWKRGNVYAIEANVVVHDRWFPLRS